MIDYLHDLLKINFISEDFIKSLIILFLAGLLYLISSKIILPVCHKLIIKSKITWDDFLIKRKVLSCLVLLPSFILIYNFSDTFPVFQKSIESVTFTLIVLICLRFITRFLYTLNDIYMTLDISKGKPIKGFIQVLIIILYIMGFLIILSVFLGTNPWVLISGLGAMTAILMLIFKDTILSFVASVRITTSGIVQIGDWLEVPKFDADGDVIDIALHNIQIQNWDKTITNIPTHKLMDDSFKNWRGMQLAGGRRIMRNILIDISSIKFCDEEMISRFEKIDLLKNYIKTKKAELDTYNKENNIDDSVKVNGRRMTNIGTFRAYIKNYLRNHPHIKQDLIFLIRQLAPESNGIPLQVYVFCSKTAWVEYEEVQADIFDHLLAVVPEFDLRVYQNPTGHDIKLALEKINHK